MATVHVATTIQVPIDEVGNVVDKKLATIGAMARVSSEIRVNVAGYPTISTYLVSEYAAGYSLRHMDQTFIVTDKP